MPRRKTSIKSTRASKKRHVRNVAIKTQLKKTIKAFLELLKNKKLEDAKKYLARVASSLDKAAKKGIIHPRTSSRRKSRLAKRLTASHRS